MLYIHAEDDSTKLKHVLAHKNGTLCFPDDIPDLTHFNNINASTLTQLKALSGDTTSNLTQLGLLHEQRLLEKDKELMNLQQEIKQNQKQIQVEIREFHADVRTFNLQESQKKSKKFAAQIKISLGPLV